MKVTFSYTPKQEEVFFQDDIRFKTLGKGRRVGFTHGVMRYLVDTSLDGTTRKVLWVDTVHANIRRYIERYMMPDLKQLPKNLWEWRMTDKLIRIGNTEIDFRSADNPENIEGFGYDLIILNEAGIILKDEYLWHNAIRPMLLDNPKSQAIIGGVPKGHNLFADLINNGLSGRKNWKHYTATTYDNPLLSKEDIDELIDELGDNDDVIQQEIFGKVVDGTGLEYFNYTSLLASTKIVNFSEDGLEVWGFDVARHGADSNVLAKRKDKHLYSIEKTSIPDTMETAEYLKEQYESAIVKPTAIFIDVTGIGWGVYDRCRQFGMPVISAVVGEKSFNKMATNKRAEMYLKLKLWLNENGKIPNHKPLLMQLSSTEAQYTEKGELKLASKEEIKKKYGKSPDEADAVALTFFDDVTEMAHEQATTQHKRMTSE